jgi:hypothetical protein
MECVSFFLFKKSLSRVANARLKSQDLEALPYFLKLNKTNLGTLKYI